MLTDTIAAISTPPGEGGIGIVRISGPLAKKIGLSLFRFAGRVHEPESHHLYFGHLFDPQSGNVVDEVLFAFMRAPRTYTREDVVEINCHGGIFPLTKTLQLVLAAGARAAEPGEFTQRAFLNGRLDLAQAEAVIQVIRAKTEAAMMLGVAQLQGRLSGEVRRLREILLPVLVQIEAAIDFPEHHEVEDVALGTIAGATEEALAQIGLLLKTAERGQIFREGLRTAIVGRPNVGKSSLLNALLGQERAIVTAIPGTTRDVLEESINIGGVALVIVDTAGIRKTQDMVESIGVLRSQQTLSGADLVLLVLDAAAGVMPEDQEILSLIGEKPCLVVINKIDLLDDPELTCRRLEQLVNPHRVVPVSVLTGQGLDNLEQAILATVFGGGVPVPEPVMITSVRHKEALRRASESLLEVQSALRNGQLFVDILAIDLHAALQALGEITGETVRAELAEEIFRNFCIGK